MRKNIIVAMASLAFLPAVSFAAAPTLSEVLDASGISVTGHVSASYAYSANQVTTFDPATISLAPAGAPGAYTGQSNSFTLNQANLSISKLPAEGFGAAVDVYGGQDAGKLNNFGSGSDFNLHQAYVQYATGGLTVMGGKYSGLAGAEVVSDAANSNVIRERMKHRKGLSKLFVAAFFATNAFAQTESPMAESCPAGIVPISSSHPKGMSGFLGKKTHFRFNLPKSGSPQDVEIISSELPFEKQEILREAFKSSYFSVKYKNGKPIAFTGCNYDFYVRPD